MRKKILILSIILVIIAGMFDFTTNVNAVTDIEISGNSVWRTDGTTATINFISDTTGMAYYKITDSSTPPADIVTGGTDGGSVTANTTKSITLTGLTSGAKYVHIVVKNGDDLSNTLTIEMPYDYYYSENFEGYNEGTYISSENLSPIEQVNNGTGNANQKVVSQVENNVLSLTSAGDWASDQKVRLDSTKLSTASKYVLEGKVYTFGNTGWRARLGFTDGAFSSLSGEVGIHFRDGNIIYKYSDATSIVLSSYESNRWYDIKIEVTPSTSKYSIYIDGVLKASDLSLNIGANSIALSSGHGFTTLYDDIKLYAVTAPTTYTVTFNTNGGSTVDSQAIPSGETALLPTEPTKDNYTFGGWYADTTLTTPFDFTTSITSATIIYAKWNPIPSIIIGNSVWRSNATTATINFISNTTGTAYYKITNSNVAPTTTDFITSGTDGGNVTANTTKNISLTGLTSGAKYVHIVVKTEDVLGNVLTIEMPYDVYYFDDFESYSENVYPGFFYMKYNGGSASNQKIITLNENKVFNAYGTYGTGLDERIQINSLSTGYAVFETDISASLLTSSWYFGGIVIGPNYDNDNRNICVQVHPDSKKIVSGENSRNHTSNILFEANKNYHVKMVLDIQNYKLDYYINNVKANDNPISIASNYYTSLNWFGIYNGAGTVYYDNMKFYATNTNPIPTYAVTFSTNGGTVIANQTITSGEIATLPTEPTKSNYTFGGWYADEELTTPFDFTTVITAPITIYAKWNPILYTVTFNTNGGSTVANQTIISGEIALLPTEPIKANYTFGGWYADATLTTEFDFTTAITAPITIYAKWNQILYTVTFNTNGGSTVVNQIITSGETVTVPTEPIKANYTFGGWYADEELTTEFDFTTVITAPTIIYAKWNQILYTVTFNTNGGSTVANQTITSGKTATEPMNPTKDNYTFEGWYADEELTTEFDFTTTITSATTIYAKWTEAFSEKTITKTEDDMTTTVKGTFSGEPVLVIAKTEIGNEGYNSLITLVKDDKKVIGSYDVTITGGTYTGDLELTFTVGKQYEGDKITVYHKKVSGDIETLIATVKDGKVVIKVSELSPFMLVTDKEVTEQKDTTPKTGDNVYLCTILVTITLAGVFVTSKLMKKSR